MAREMKNSGIEWIGEIPSYWETRKNKYLLDSMYSGGTPSASNPSFYAIENGIPFVSISDMSSVDYVKTTKKSLTEEGVEDKNLTILPIGTVLYSIYATVGVVSELAIEATISQAMLALSIKPILNKSYYKYCLSSMEKYIFGSANGNTQFNLNAEKVWNFVFPFPPLSEQKVIADFLDRICAEIDAVIAKTKATIEEYKALEQSVITEAVTKGIRGDRIMKDSGIKWVKEIPVNWENRKMLSILSMRVIDGPHESPELFDDGVPYVSANAIENGRINFDKKRGFISEEYCDLCDKRYRPQRDDILVIKLGATTGQVAIVDTDERFNIWVPLAVVRCNNLALPKFVYYAMQSDYYIRQMEMSWTYGTQQTLGVKTIERLRIIIPELEEQKEIATYLDKKCAEIDTLIAKKTALLEEMENYKKSVIYEYVTGKKEVK